MGLEHMCAYIDRPIEKKKAHTHTPICGKYTSPMEYLSQATHAEPKPLPKFLRRSAWV